MPNYKVQLKQGKRTIVEYIEAANVASVLQYYEAITTMKVTEILKIEYENLTDNIPVDDFNYTAIFKGFVKDTASNKTRQIIHHNLKTSIDFNDIASLIKSTIKIDGAAVDSVYCTLMKAK